MITCPICNTRQETSDTCEDCGYDFNDASNPISTNTSNRKMAGIAILILFVIIATGVHYTQKKNFEKTHPEVSTEPATNNPLDAFDLNISVEDIVPKSGFSGGSLITAIFFSILGMAYLMFGRNTNQYIMIFTGIALMTYSYLIHDAITMLVIGIQLCCLPFIMRMIID